MANPTMNREYPDSKQRYAVCNSQLRRRCLMLAVDSNINIKEFEEQIKFLSNKELLNLHCDLQKGLCNVVCEGMSKRDWINAWKKDPHWATSMKPSPLAKYLVSEMKQNKLKGKILEIGCGNGRDAIYFGKQSYDVVGIDISPDAIKIAKDNNDLSNVKFQVGDAEALSFSDDSFDAVYSVSVLHSTNMKKSVKELSRVLNSSGLSSLYLYNRSSYQNEEEVNFKIGDLEKIFSINELQILDKWRDTIDDEDDDGKHTHSLIVYLLRRK